MRSQSADGDPAWREARASIHFDGSVSIAFTLGGLRNGPETYYSAWEFDSAAVEGAVADFMGLVRIVGANIGSVDYEIRVGIERNGPERMEMKTVDQQGFPFTGVSTPMHRFTPVEATVEVGTDDGRFLHQVRVLAQDCVNQGGITNLRTLATCTCEECQQ